MHITIHIFVNTVTNRGVVAIDAPVSGVVVRVNRGARCGHAVDELMQCRLVGPVDRPGLYLARGPIPFAPMMATLPTGPRPRRNFLLACLLRSLPPK